MTIISGTAQLRPVVPKSTCADSVEATITRRVSIFSAAKLSLHPATCALITIFRRELASPPAGTSHFLC